MENSSVDESPVKPADESPVKPVKGESKKKATSKKKISFKKKYLKEYIRHISQIFFFVALLVLVVGTFCSLFIRDQALSCPTGSLQILFSGKTLTLALLVSVIPLVVLTLVLGRVFCSWICPIGSLTELFSKVGPKDPRWPGFLRSRFTKYGILAGALSVGLFVRKAIFCPVCPIGTVCRSVNPTGLDVGPEALVIPIVAGLELGEKKTFCKYLCPVGATLGILGKFKLYGPRINQEKCKKCKLCIKACSNSMDIIHQENIEGKRISKSECIMCYKCVDACPYGALKMKVGF